MGAILDDDGGDDKGVVWILFMDTNGKVKSFQKISDTEGDFGGVLDDRDFFGISVASIGDLDGDGVTDLAVGAPDYITDFYREPVSTTRGAVWILFMKSIPIEEPLTCGGEVVTIIGTEGNDVIVGTPGIDVIHGLGGNDNIEGRGGNDLICGGDGDDEINGGMGDDVIYGSGGNDMLFGLQGNDKMYGDSGEDKLYGGVGNDRLSGGADNDELFGGMDNDRLFGREGNDRIFGDAGNDALHGNLGNDLLVGGEGDDRLLGNSGNDRLFGGNGNDSLEGLDGDDLLFGGLGDDELDGGADNDELHGGDGTDTCIDGEKLLKCEYETPAIDFEVLCTSQGQLCEPLYTTSVQTTSNLQVEFAMSDDICSSLKVHIFVDGEKVYESGFLGWYGAPEPYSELPLRTDLLNLGPVSSGTHEVGLQAEGQVSGCNTKGIGLWNGSLTILT